VGSAVPVANLSGASVLITRNYSQDVFDVMDAAGLLNSRFEFSFNTVEGATWAGGWLYDEPSVAGSMVTQTTSSEILVNNNVISGLNGVYLDSTFTGGSTCRVVSNNFPNVTDVGIYLGVGTSHCLVMGNSKTTIENLGKDNVIVKRGFDIGAVGRVAVFAGRRPNTLNKSE
jgi:hypothetical protein